ncbi:methyltransferase-like protein 17, mitochondrial [Contarinia nasturtii]|uniref:methyltransferase-like protein 17, mitochondrial n=1 Tax=Contarinia nasturtii TaxID=265458 RepID=UPI0012D48EC1|nr:methyltransferase-like protein 17, mitochondrial [Contarinia nasturtii]
MLHFKGALLLRNVFRLVQVRSWSSFSVHLDDKINKDLEEELYKPKNHPGRVNLGPIEIPERIRKAIKTAMDQSQIPQLVDEGEKLDRHLFARRIPLEQKEIYTQKKSIEKEILKNVGVQRVSDLAGDDNSRAKESLKYEVLRIYYQRNYNWKPIVYDEFRSRTHLFGRADKEYAAVLKVLSEIAKRDPQFQPHSFFDFGAGVGTGTWAVSELWKKSVYEYFLVDQSGQMNDLAELILRDGNDQKAVSLRNVFYRQFLPASDEFKSHLILSAFTLNELPDLKTRLDTLLTLWKKCDGYMVLIENGTNTGFKLIEEAREFLTQQANRQSGYLFAPCPHEMACPRVLKDDGTPCNFSARYRSLDIGQRPKDEIIRYSYVVFKKGSRDDDPTMNWPRLVRPTQVRTRHTRCKLCTHRGKLEELVVTKGKHSKNTYGCARKSDWGDRMPVEIVENECDSTDKSDDEKLVEM